MRVDTGRLYPIFALAVLAGGSVWLERITRIDDPVTIAEQTGPDFIAHDTRVVGFNSLLMDFADAQGAAVVIRGIRGVTDFEYEYQLTGMNRPLNARVETVFLMADVSLQPIASRLVKEIALYGGDISKFVTPKIRQEVIARVEQSGGKGG